MSLDPVRNDWSTPHTICLELNSTGKSAMTLSNSKQLLKTTDITKTVELLPQGLNFTYIRGRAFFRDTSKTLLSFQNVSKGFYERSSV